MRIVLVDGVEHGSASAYIRYVNNGIYFVLKNISIKWKITLSLWKI